MAVDGHLNFDTLINTNGFQKGLKNIGTTLSSLKGTVMNLAGAFGFAFSTAALINFSKSAKELYNVQLEGETKLETVLGKHLDATKEQIQATKDYASALQEVGVIGDEVQLAGLQELSTYIGNPDSLKKMNVVLNDMLAQQYGLNATAESAVTISTMLGKVLAGQTSALSRYGYTFDEAQEKLLKYGTEEQRVATLADVVLNSVGGMNEALAQTPAGRMKQLENTMGDIKERFGEAVTQIEVLLLPALKQLANALQFIADKANEVAQALSNVFGTKSNKKVSTAGAGNAGNIDENIDLIDTTGDLADEAEDTADSYENMAKAAEDANKANNEDLANFDKLNVKAKETADSTEDYADNKAKAAKAKAAAEKAVDEAAEELGTEVSFDVEADTDEAESTLTKLIKNIKSSLESLFEPIKKSWVQYGEAVVESVKNNFASVKNLVSSIGKTFADVWTNGTGERIVGNILNIFTNINNTITNISDNFRTVWDSGGGLSIVQKLADTFNTVLEHINNISEKTSEWSENVNFEPVLTAFDKLLTPIQKIVDLAGTWTESVWEKVFLPLASWAIEEGVPAALDAIGGFLNLVAAIGENVGILLGAIWDGFFAKLASWAGDAIVGFLQGIGKFFKDISENETAVSVIIGIAAALGMVAAAMNLINTAQAIYNALMAVNPTTWIIMGIIAAVAAVIIVIIEVITYWDTLKEIFSEGIQWWKNLFSNLWNTIVTYWSDKLLKIGQRFKTIIVSFKEFIGDVKTYWGNLFKNLWNSVKNWWNNTFIAGWKSALATVKNTFSNLWQGIKNIAKSAVNAVIGFVNGMINGAANGINKIIDIINNLSWDIPDWIPGIGGGTFGFDIQHITPPQIPYLATGTVVPANYGEFAAILGDNKREPEVVSPLSTIKQAMIEALTEVGYSGRNDGDIVIQIGNREVFRAVKEEAEHWSRSHGGKPAFG